MFLSMLSDKLYLKGQDNVGRFYVTNPFALLTTPVSETSPNTACKY